MKFFRENKNFKFALKTTEHRRRIKTEEKAKVVASAWVFGGRIY